MSDRLRKIVKFGGLESARWLRSEMTSRAARKGAAARRKIWRLAIISDRGAWCSDQQLNPFDEFRTQLRETLGISFQQFYLDSIGLFPPFPLALFDVVMVKLSYRTDVERAAKIVAVLKKKIGSTPLVYMDGDDDICIQWGDVVAACDVYVKEHAFLDRSKYQVQFQGKSNLHDYAITRHGHVLSGDDYSRPDQEPLIIHNSGVVRDEDLGKIVVGWNMALAKDILELWRKVRNQLPAEKKIDCAFRGSVKINTITGYMRRDASAHLENLSRQFNIRVSASHLPLDEYYTELMESRICVSPFGFGELCWRDFEAVLCRSLLIKPDMGHIETSPNIFRPHVTYIPVKWDLSDLEEVCRFYLNHEDKRREIAENAYAVLDNYYTSFGFAGDLSKIMALACPSFPGDK